MSDLLSRRAKFHAMTEGTQEDWRVITAHSAAHSRDLPSRLMAHLQLLKGDFGGFAVDRLERDDYEGHPDYAACAHFCEVYDQAAFDPGFVSMPIEAFAPMVARMFARPQRSIYMRK